MLLSPLEPFELFLLTITLASLALQLYVIWVIYHASPGSMRDYRPYLTRLTAWDAIFTAFIGIGLQPSVMFPLSGAIVRGLFATMGQQGAYIGLVAVFFAGAQVLTTQCDCLIFRLAVILRVEGFYKGLISKRGSLICRAIDISIGLAFSLPMYWCVDNGTVEVAVQLDPEHDLVKYPYLLALTDASAVRLFLDLTASSIWAYAGCLLAGFALLEAVCFAMGYTIVRVLRQNAHCFTARTYRMHMQLTVLVALQLASPVLYIVLPISMVCLYSVFYCQRLSLTAGQVGITAMALYATNNSLLTLCFVTPYRRYTMKKMRKIVLSLMGPTLRLCRGVIRTEHKPSLAVVTDASTIQIKFTNRSEETVGSSLGRCSMCSVSVVERRASALPAIPPSL